MQAGKGASVETIHREMTAFARRARTAVARMHPQLSLVAYTLLAHMSEHRDCRATDLAQAFLLDKSTVSRQVATLERLGLVERRPEPADHRVQVLLPTAAGAALLAEANRAARHIVCGRLADWDDTDLERFAAYLTRYNDAAEQQA